MAAQEIKSSFLGALSPWGVSRTTTPSPKLGPTENVKEADTMKLTSGADHVISLRPSPSLRHYPRDCPPLRARWFYAVDVPKRKPFSTETATDKAAPAPKKLVPFSANDSQSIETAFQALDRDHGQPQEHGDNVPQPDTKVPVNEDYLFDVNIEKRELEPAYWIGPVYEVRRGSWFYQEGSTLRPCDENLANQLEEGYLRVAPWRKSTQDQPRSSSQPRKRPLSTVFDNKCSAQLPGSMPVSPKLPPTDAAGSKAEPGSRIYRLFGTHMNSTVTYQDSTTAWLTSDDFMSRMSSTVYGTFGTLGGTKIVRGYAESGKSEDPKTVEVDSPKETKGQTGVAKPPGESDNVTKTSEEKDPQEGESLRHHLSPLQRQISSLAGARDTGSSEDLAEEVRQEEEKEMEDSRGKDANEQGREIEHLVLVTHGIGQRLGLRLDSINFVHDVNSLRKTMKAVYASAPDLQALNSQADDMKSNCRVQVLPISWRHLLDFPKQSVRDNKREYDLGDCDGIDEDDYPSLADITVDGVPAVRNLITDLAMDVLLYQSAYREHIAGIVQRECNRVYKLFKQRNPKFSGKVSLCGHSLGSAILFDILCRQRDPKISTGLRRMSVKNPREKAPEQRELRLDFECENFFCLGSPIALFQMLKGRTIAGRKGAEDIPPESPFDPDPMSNDPFGSDVAVRSPEKSFSSSSQIPISTSSPKCSELFNIFHPTDPIAYRMEPLISPAMASLKAQPLPYTKKGLFDAPGIANIGARVGHSVGSMWFNLTSGVASSLINRSLGITGDEAALSQDGALKGSTTLPTSPKKPDAEGPSITQPISDGKRQQELADAALSAKDVENLPTLIDTEIETLSSGFEKRRQSHNSGDSDPNEGSGFKDAQEKARKLKREEAKVRALNSNGRVDYSVQEGIFDISLLASIASHLSYWADEDVNHFMVGQMLKRGRDRGRGSG